MNYVETVEWLFQQFPAYQKIGANAYKPDLHNVEKLCALFDYPEKEQQFIHVAGTNGKGSTCSIIASCLVETGYSVGLFTSPHIKSFTERIRINGKAVEEKFVIDFVNKLQNAKLDYAPSFFEISFVMSLVYFKEEKTDINIIETGLGGRLDATNIINPLLSVITNIGLEHVNFLGDTLEKIAGEKAGIIKDNVPVVIGEFQNETYPVFEKFALDNNAPIHLTNQNETLFDTCLLLSDYLIKNARTAYNTLTVLEKYYPHFSYINSNFEKGLKNLAKNSGLKGRMQVIRETPLTIFDAAHNIEGIHALLSNSIFSNTQKLHIVYGTSADKNLDRISKLFPTKANYYFTEFKNNRSAKIEDLENVAKENNLNFFLFKKADKAFYKAQISANEEDIILVFGSFFLLDDLF